jgi:BirA family transcriptional regulator, biotin operon repressor / biotin---[acetyl-CoA-carboxylase] ligase
LIRIVGETGSTNADVAALLRQGADFPDGDWLVADRQGAGRGRQGRAWSDGAGNFMGSTAIRLQQGDPPASSLALVAGIALHDAVLPFSGMPQQLLLKWPNDLMLLGAKLAGILLEREGSHVVIGIGVNLAQAPFTPGRESICLAQMGPAPDRNAFAAALADALAARVAAWRVQGLPPVLSAWAAAAHPVGTPLAVHGADGAWERGRFDGLEPDGALRLRLDNGTGRVIHAGDVMLGGE